MIYECVSEHIQTVDFLFSSISPFSIIQSEAADVAMIIVKDVARTFASSDYFKLGDGKVRELDVHTWCTSLHEPTVLFSWSNEHSYYNSNTFTLAYKFLSSYKNALIFFFRLLSGRCFFVQAVLSRLLLAFQRLAPDPGYVQGMATLAAVVLLTFHGGGKAGSLAEKDDDDDDGRNNVSIVLGKKKQNDNREIAPDRRPMPTPQVCNCECCRQASSFV